MTSRPPPEPRFSPVPDPGTPAPAPPATAAAGPAIELGHEVPGRQSLCQGMSVPAVRAGNPILLAQVGANSHPDRFFAHVKMDEAGHSPFLIVLLRGQLELPQQHHLLVQPQALSLVRQGMRRFHLHCFFHTRLVDYHGPVGQPKKAWRTLNFKVRLAHDEG